MRERQVTTSAALYFAVRERETIPLDWFERARRLFAQYSLSPILFSADGGGFLPDDCYVLAEPGGSIVSWGEVLVSRVDDLVHALRDGVIEGLGLDSPRPGAEDREDWRAMVDVSLSDGVFYVGLDDELTPEPVSLLRRAYEIMRGLFDVRYAIAYKSPLAERPDCYASGYATHSVSEVLDMIRHRHEWSCRRKSPDELWCEELNGERRHLTRLLRGAYPASILSESHVDAAGLRLRRVGRLSELDASHWLWELWDSEVPIAEKMLEAQGVLVASRVNSGGGGRFGG